jgi:hypothetical protein
MQRQARGECDRGAPQKAAGIRRNNGLYRVLGAKSVELVHGPREGLRVLYDGADVEKADPRLGPVGNSSNQTAERVVVHGDVREV